MYARFAQSVIDLRTDRISQEDGSRQERSAEEILRRLARRPGVILADEAGMGKTFVAMAVAASIILDQPDSGPVIVMTPPSLRHKWPKDWSVFAEKCLTVDDRLKIRHAEADSGLDLLKLLDEQQEIKRHIIFLTHGALDRALTDGYVKLAVIQRTFKWRSFLGEQQKNFQKVVGKLLRMESVEKRAPGLLGELLERPFENWFDIIQSAHDDFKNDLSDDPVPRYMHEALDEIEREEIEPLVEQLRRLPLRHDSANFEERLKEARRALVDVMSEIWRVAFKRAGFASPLLILDEAHHLKNPATRPSSLFVDEEAARESKYFEPGGPLGGKFERMLFLTSTPFQLGPSELVRVLERFDGIAWQGLHPPELPRADFRIEVAALAKALDEAQVSTIKLDRAWGKLTEEHLRDGNGDRIDVEQWWEQGSENPGNGLFTQIFGRVDTARQKIRVAENLLRPWMLRHLRSKHLPDLPYSIERRQIFPGAAINDNEMEDAGLRISDKALLPFLLANRAQTLLAAGSRGRALFAEALSSSFEAFVETLNDPSTVDEDGDLQHSVVPEEAKWYLERLDKVLPRDDQSFWREHPKIRATAERVVRLWKEGEKVLIFCHYRATGRALRYHISYCLEAEILKLGHSKLPHLREEQIRDELERIGKRFFDVDGLLRNEVVGALHRIIEPFDGLKPGEVLRIVDVVRRFLRTPSFLTRYFDLAEADHAGAFAEAIQRWDVGGLSLRQRIDEFCSFLTSKCTPYEREAYLESLDTIQTGSHVGRFSTGRYEIAESEADSQKTLLLPNVRLASGLVNHDTRRRLLLAFNTPFFPEILIASSVVAEGLDLHGNCRHIIHHDLCWNPFTLEQRTNRVDRIGSMAERIGEPIKIYLPFIEAAQDEKIYRVVRDRERWSHIIMGDRYEVDEAATDRLSRRVPLPDALLKELMMNLQTD
jgi:ERCC4-related helicase